jgi:hypothetical protein
MPVKQWIFAFIIKGVEVNWKDENKKLPRLNSIPSDDKSKSTAFLGSKVLSSRIR